MRLLKQAGPAHHAARVAAALLTLCVLALPGGSHAATLGQAIRENAHTLSLDADGNLVGSGSHVLLLGGRQAQFVLIGEEHGVAEVPAITGALFRALVPSGYRHLAIETGFPIARELNQRAADGGVGAIGEFIQTHYPGTPFYNVREEAELLVSAVEAAGGGPDVLWGLDYEIMGDRYPLRRVRELAPDEQARDAVDEVIAVADSMLDAALAAGNPGNIFCFAGDAVLIEDLMDLFGPDLSPEAWDILQLLVHTMSINQMWLEKRVFESNRARATNLNEQFMKHYQRALDVSGTPPRVMLKFGANHMLRGWNFTEQLDLGTLTSVIADANRSRSFNVMIVGGRGGKHAGFDPKTFGVAERPAGFVDNPWIQPFLGVDHWTVYDLRPLLRPVLGRDFGEVPGRLEQIVRGFDVLIVIPEATASTHLAPR